MEQTFEEKTIEMAETVVSQLTDKAELTIFESSLYKECSEIIETWEGRQTRLSKYITKLEMNRQQCVALTRLPMSDLKRGENIGRRDVYEFVISALKSIQDES